MTAARPTDSKPWDAVIVGGGVNGLATAAYMARAGKRVLLLEANEAFGGRAERSALAGGRSASVAAERYSAVDHELIRDFDLHGRGLRFVQRAMPLIVLRPDGRHLKLPHDYFGARAAIRSQSDADAVAYGDFRTALFRTARGLRRLWAPSNASLQRRNEAGRPAPEEGEAGLSAADARELDKTARSSANAYLQRWFENETVKTALGFDATLDGASPDDASSALHLLWRAAQEVSGLQGAICQTEGGPGALADALAETARSHGAILLPRARVGSIDIQQGRAAGVTLETGSALEAACVFSNLGRRRTLVDLVAPSALPIGAQRLQTKPGRIASAKVILALSGLPPFAGLSRRDLEARLVIADHPETAGEAKGAALIGELPAELVLEVNVPSVADESLSPQGIHALSVRVPYLPARIHGGWDAAEDGLRKRVLAALEVYAPGLRDRVIDNVVITPTDFLARYGAESRDGDPAHRFLTRYESRLRTPVAGLYLCGSDADPVGAVAGRAGRLAAALALADLAEAIGVTG